MLNRITWFKDKLATISKGFVAIIALSIYLSLTSMCLLPSAGPQPIPAKAVIYLNFTGYKTSDSTMVFGKLKWSASKLSYLKKYEIMQEVATLYSQWQVTVTVDPEIFYSYPQDHRIQAVISSDTLVKYTYYGISYPGGLSYLNTLLFQDSTPSVISEYAFDTQRNLARAVAHEIGHQLGLAHQPRWGKGFDQLEEYSTGDSLSAPIMGNPYKSIKATWVSGINNLGMWQDDVEIISKTILLRPIKKLP